ncbi:MAG: CarD family transcriptional regulator, partial [Beijerinckiaceae bacterium]|nr:CarD family transcriptional regulator [Beijerinckiaceae bacterium]
SSTGDSVESKPVPALKKAAVKSSALTNAVEKAKAPVKKVSAIKAVTNKNARVPGTVANKAANTSGKTSGTVSTKQDIGGKKATAVKSVKSAMHVAAVNTSANKGIASKGSASKPQSAKATVAKESIIARQAAAAKPVAVADKSGPVNVKSGTVKVPEASSMSKIPATKKAVPEAKANNEATLKTKSRTKLPSAPSSEPDAVTANAARAKPKPAAAKPATRGSKAAAAPVKAEAPARPRPMLASGSSGATLAPLAVPPPPKAKPQSNGPGAPGRQQLKAAAPQNGFKVGDYIVYPAHGVGQILAVEKQEVAGFTLELFVINFLQDKMTLKVPMPKVLDGAIRKLSDSARVDKALDTLTGRARIKRTMWSRRAQEYEAKINSGDLVTIAEVVRDLYRSETQPEQSYSERQLYEAALDRMAREIAVVKKLEGNDANSLIEEHLKRGPRRGAKADADAAADSAADDHVPGSAVESADGEAIGKAA